MKKYFYLSLSILVVAANLLTPACGSKNDNATSAVPYVPGTGSGVVCNSAGVCTQATNLAGSGVPLLPAPAVATNFDNYGSTLALSFSATQSSVVNQAGYSGPVLITGVLTIATPVGSCPAPGQYTVTGQGTYSAGYGAAEAGVTGTLQLSGAGGQGTAQLDPSLVHNITSVGVSSYILGMQLEVPSCGRIISTPYN